MKRLFEHISQKSGLTKTEIYTFFFVILVFLIGYLAKEAKYSSFNKTSHKYEYSFYDSLFKALNENYKVSSTEFKNKEKRVDSEVELSDFSNNKLDIKLDGLTDPLLKSININTADENTLIKIPGIGKTIAQRIIELRNRKGGFKNIEELTEVKRIGPKKLKSIKKYFYIEN